MKTVAAVAVAIAVAIVAIVSRSSSSSSSQVESFAIFNESGQKCDVFLVKALVDKHQLGRRYELSKKGHVRFRNNVFVADEFEIRELPNKTTNQCSFEECRSTRLGVSDKKYQTVTLERDFTLTIQHADNNEMYTHSQDLNIFPVLRPLLSAGNENAARELLEAETIRLIEVVLSHASNGMDMTEAQDLDLKQLLSVHLYLDNLTLAINKYTENNNADNNKVYELGEFIETELPNVNFDNKKLYERLKDGDRFTRHPNRNMIFRIYKTGGKSSLVVFDNLDSCTKTSVEGWADYTSSSGTFGVYIYRATFEARILKNIDAVEQQQQHAIVQQQQQQHCSEDRYLLQYYTCNWSSLISWLSLLANDLVITDNDSITWMCRFLLLLAVGVVALLQLHVTNRSNSVSNILTSTENYCPVLDEAVFFPFYFGIMLIIYETEETAIFSVIVTLIISVFFMCAGYYRYTDDDTDYVNNCRDYCFCFYKFAVLPAFGFVHIFFQEKTSAVIFVIIFTIFTIIAIIITSDDSTKMSFVFIVVAVIEVIIINFGGTSIANISVIISFIAIAVVRLYLCRSGYSALLINVAGAIAVGVIVLPSTRNFYISDDVIFMSLCLGVLATLFDYLMETNNKVLVMTVVSWTNTMMYNTNIQFEVN